MEVLAGSQVNYNLIKTKLEKFNPLSEEYSLYWKEEFRKIIEGFWIGNFFVSGPMYFYANYWTIEAKGKFINPLIRDIEREKFLWFEEARGFSGFEGDTEFHCDYKLSQLSQFGNNKRTYLSIRDYLTKFHKGNLGRPLYENQSKNVIDIECHHYKTKVLKYDGTIVEIDFLQVGDLLMGPDSKPRKVLNKIEGVGKFYKIKSKRYKDQFVTENHIVPLKYHKYINGKYINNKRTKGNYINEDVNISIKDLLLKQDQPSFTNKYYIYQSKLINFNQNSILKIDPYFLGLWLSDGRSNCTIIKITDIVLKNYLENFYKDNNFEYVIKEIDPIKEHHLNSYECYSYDLEFRKAFKDLNLINNKHIPQIYLTSSVEDRIQLLSGLIDGDGCKDKYHNSYDIYCGVSESIADSCVLLAKSLGLYANKTVRHRKFSKITYEVLISGDITILKPKIERKKPLAINIREDKTRSSFKIEKTELVDKFISIEVDQDNLFILDDYVVTHNCRGSGKTKLGSALIGYTFITDGIKDIKKYLIDKQIEEDKAGYEIKFPYKSNSVISSIDSKYSNKVVDDFWIGYNKIRGGVEFNGVKYPSPITKKYSGSLVAGGKGLTAHFEDKMKGEWITSGSGSFIRHVTYFNNPAAANGFRSAFILDDEVGFQDNLLDTFGQLKECTQVEGDKFGIVWLTGTGGDMKGGATQQAKKIFYNPDDYNCLVYKDIYENKGNIGCFVPRYKVLSEFKDEQGNTNEELAKQTWEKDYNKAISATDSSVLDMFLQNNPAVPSHAFLSLTGNKYPTAQLQEQKSYLESNRDTKLLMGTIGDLNFINDGSETLEFKPNMLLKDCGYPILTHNKKGGTIIYEHPTSVNPTKIKYISGCDPIAADGKKEDIQSDSVASCLIYKRSTVEDPSGDILVAEYTGRENTVAETNENIRKLLLYYNALCLYENNYTNLKDYLDNKKQLYLLAKTPRMATNSASNKAGVTYGVGVKAGRISEELELYAIDWLLQKNPNGKFNYQNIKSIPLLEEFIAAGEGVNTDRESAFKVLILLKMQLDKIKTEENKQQEKEDFFKRKFFQ